MIKQVSLNSSWLLSGRILTMGVNVVFVALIARRLGVNVFGQYALFTSIVYLGNFFTTYGTDVLLIREIAREKTISNTVYTALWLQLFLSCFWILMVFAVAIFFIDDVNAREILFIVNVSLIPLAFQTVYNSILRAVERMDFYAGLNFFNIFIQTISVYYLIHRSDDFFKLCILILASQTLTTCAGFIICRNILPALEFIKKPSISEALILFRMGFQLAMLAPFAALFQRSNLFILSFILGTETAGFLSAASRLVEGIKIGHFSVSNSLMPTMARPVSLETGSTLRLSLVFLLSWSLLAALCLTFFAAQIVGLIYGESYDVSANILRIIGWVLIPYTFSVYYSLNMTMKGSEALVLQANLVALPLAVVWCFILISIFGLLGAAWSILINEIMFALILFLFYCYSCRSVLNGKSNV